MSLGTTAVERTWWPDHVRNVNKTARWATDAWRQYRAVVAWKHDVVTVLRKAEEPLRKGRGGGKFLHSLERTIALLQCKPRAYLRLGVLGGKNACTDCVRRPQSGEVFMGHCLDIRGDDSEGGHANVPFNFCRRLMCDCVAGHLAVVDSDEDLQDWCKEREAAGREKDGSYRECNSIVRICPTSVIVECVVERKASQQKARGNQR